MKREVLNKLLLLKLIQLAGKINEQKIGHLVFILQNEGRKEKRTTFNYDFIKWNIEPYSKELENDLSQLELEEMVIVDHGLMLDERGKFFINQSQSIYESHEVDQFFKFFIYVHLNTSLYETVDYIFKRYEVGKIGENEAISSVRVENKEELSETEMAEAKKEINLKYEELEKNEQNFVERINSIMNGSFFTKDSDLDEELG